MPRSSEWAALSATALRHGQSLEEASRAYRAANAHLHNPGDGTSPEMQHRHHRTKRVGALLRRGVSFHDAVRQVDRGFDAYQHAQRGLERSITHPSRANPPRRNPSMLVIGGVAAAAVWWFFLRKPTGTAAPAAAGVTVPGTPTPAGAPSTDLVSQFALADPTQQQAYLAIAPDYLTAAQRWAVDVQKAQAAAQAAYRAAHP